MDGGIPRVGLGLNAHRADRVSPKKDREREEQADFAEAMEHRNQEEPKRAPLGTPPGTEFPDIGYPGEDEAGTSLDLEA